jgi:PAS domain-containing protein
MINMILLQKLLVILFGIGNSGRQIFWNKGIEAVFGYKRNIKLVPNWWQNHPEDSYQNVY